MSSDSGPAASRRDELAVFVTRTRLFLLSYMSVLLIFALESRSWFERIGYAAVAFIVLVIGFRITYGQLRNGRHREQFAHLPK